MDKVTIQIDSKWVRIVRSPLFWVVGALQGVSLTFAPLFLYWSGKGRFFPEAEWIIVPSCFAVIFLVGLFYLRLGGEVIRELRKVSGL
jgi:hypothetical protein